MVTESWDAAILWDAETGQEVRTFQGHTGPVSCVAFSQDGRKLLTGYQDGEAVLWDVTTGERRRTFSRQ